MTSATKDSRTRLLDAALQVIRAQGYPATTVDALCAAAGVNKGSFFHHFKSKDALALAAVAHWNALTGALFAQAPYQQLADPRARLLAYIDLRAALLQGEPAQFSCLLGTMVQDVFATHPTLRQACEDGMARHVDTVAADIAAAKAACAPAADWDPRALAWYTQAVLQGAFVLAKAQGSVAMAQQCVAQLRAHLTALLPEPAAPAASAPPPAEPPPPPPPPPRPPRSYAL